MDPRPHCFVFVVVFDASGKLIDRQNLGVFSDDRLAAFVKIHAANAELLLEFSDWGSTIREDAQRGPCVVKYRPRSEPDEVIEEEALPTAVAVA